MGIRMLNGFGSIQPYQRNWEIPKVSPEEVKQQDAQKAQEINNYSQSVEIKPVEDNRSRTADLENISLTFNKEESYDYIGSESGLANLDMQKAISDMRKDQMLQEYQYFVGSSSALFQSEDGIVIPK